MEVTLKDIIKLAKELPEEAYEDAYKKLQDAKETAEAEKESSPMVCIRCGGTHVVRNGKSCGHQAYLCKDCGKGFVQTSTSAIANSHSSEAVWKQVIRDTVDGISLDETAEHLDLSHSTVFNMRHKILLCIEQEISDSNIPLEGVNEVDETYVLESVKGTKIPDGYHRKPRRHGAKASKRGISNEYVCVCASVGEDNLCTAKSVNRAVPTQDEIEQVYGDKVTKDTVILCDGSKGYDVLEDKCTVAHTSRVNKVNGFHSFIKGRLDKACGVATKYLNRYNALFATVFGDSDAAVNRIFELMTARNGSFQSIASVKVTNLLEV